MHIFEIFVSFEFCYLCYMKSRVHSITSTETNILTPSMHTLLATSLLYKGSPFLWGWVRWYSSCCVPIGKFLSESQAYCWGAAHC